MPHDRARLNSLIFHNPVVLPRTSPGFGEVSLAVAELQGGNSEKAAILAEIAVGKDPSLAAGWLAKMAADVFEASADDLRKERAVFCMDRALELVPSCRVEIIEFFLVNILGHYVEVLCEQAVWDAEQWIELDTQADQLEAQAKSMGWQAAQLRGDAGLLEAAGLVTAFVALFSRRLGTKLLTGAASLVAFSEAGRSRRDAALLDARATYLRAAGSELREQGSEHQTASMLHLVPARDLIELGSQLARAEGLSPRLLDPTIQGFVATFRQVGDAHLGWLRRRLLSPVWDAIDGNRSGLEKSYVEVFADQAPFARFRPSIIKVGTKEPHPLTKNTLLWLEHMVPGATKLEEYRLLAYPLPTVRRRGVAWGTMEKDQNFRKNSAINAAFLAVCCVVAALVFGSVTFMLCCGALSGLLALSSLWSHARVVKRERLQSLFASALNIDTWVPRPASTPPAGGPPIPSLLPAAQASPKKRSGRLGWFACLGCTGMMGFVGLVLLVAIFGHHRASLDVPVAAPSPTATLASTATPQPVRRAVPVAAATPLVTSPAPTSAAETVLYEVTGIAAGDALNVRSGPGATNEVSARLPNGYRHIQIIGAPVLNGTTPWVQIRFGERTGWVTRPYLRPE